MRAFILALVVLLAGCASDQRAESAPTFARGRAIAQTQCGSCHAIGSSGESALPEAPPFRQLSRHYRLATLEEALGEGISVGHPAMPEFQFDPDDVDALIAYLNAIQETPET